MLHGRRRQETAQRAEHRTFRHAAPVNAQDHTHHSDVRTHFLNYISSSFLIYYLLGRGPREITPWPQLCLNLLQSCCGTWRRTWSPLLLVAICPFFFFFPFFLSVLMGGGSAVHGAPMWFPECYRGCGNALHLLNHLPGSSKQLGFHI